MNDLTVYITVGLVIPGLLVIGVALRQWLQKWSHGHYHHHHHHPA
jgi:hypothetical protein